MSIVDELRHLDGVKGNFYVTEQEYVAPSTFRENSIKSSNLVSNAIKFTNKGGSILITEEERIVDNRNQIVVSIKDIGRGIDAELMPKLFSKFVAKSEKGTGLGLFISKNIVEAHGGKIWVQNNDSGLNTVGATFTFSLPLVRPGNAKSETATRDASKF